MATGRSTKAGSTGKDGSIGKAGSTRKAGSTGTPRRTARLDPDELADLEEQRDFLLRSLADLEAEHDAGDLDDDDYAELRDDYTVRAAEVIRAIDDQRAAFAAARAPRNPGRTAAATAGVVVFALIAGLLVARSLGARQPGDTLTGGIDVEQSASQRAQQCIPAIDPFAPSEAIECFQAVLDDDPRNPVALTWLGWQLGLSAAFIEDRDQAADLEGSAAQLVDRAIEVNPSYSYARAFRAVLAFRRGDYADAQRYLEEFEANDPSPDARQVIEAEDLAARIAEALAAETGEEPEGGDPGGGDSDGGDPGAVAPAPTTEPTGG